MTSSSRTTTSTAPSLLATATQHAHPQAVNPVAGQVDRSGSSPQAKALATVSSPLHDAAPNGPASVTSAPAAGAPSDAQVRAAVSKFKRAVAQYHLDRLNLAYALLDPSQLPQGQYYVSIASVFTDYGLPIACGGVLHVPQLGVANKTLPCGTMVTFVYNGRAVRVPVIDRGPYIAGREWDLTGATAEALHFPGLGPIYWRIG
jgi:rare lipoprotein A (peptidoglycan hydrolase)